MPGLAIVLGFPLRLEWNSMLHLALPNWLTHDWRQRFSGHFLSTVRLAGPVVATRVGILILVAVDLAMTGRAGELELAYLSIGIAPQILLLLIGIGMLFGTAVLVSQAHGAGDSHLSGGIWRLAALHGVVMGVVFGGLCFGGEWFLGLVGQQSDIARGGGDVMAMFGWGMPAIFVAIATWLFLEGIGRPLPGLMVIIGANIVNALLNWIFVYGNVGAPEMGATGAVLATTIVRWMMAASLVGYAIFMPGHARYGVRGGMAGAWERARVFRRIGFPFAAAQGIEAGAFSTVILFAGYLGTASLGGYQIAQNLIALIFMGALGIGTATGVRVGNAVGRGDAAGVKWAGWTGTCVVILAMLIAAALLVSAPGALVGVYSQDPEVVAAAVPTVMVAAGMLVFDGMQGVLMSALRGAGDVWLPVLFHGIAFWGFMVPGAAVFAFSFGIGTPGLMLGAWVGVLVAAVLLTARFSVVSSRPVRRL